MSELLVKNPIYIQAYIHTLAEALLSDNRRYLVQFKSFPFKTSAARQLLMQAEKHVNEHA